MRDIIREINQLCDKYGDDFDWGIVPEKNGLKARLYGKLNSDKIEALSGGNLGVLLV